MRLAAEAGQPEVGLRLVDAALETIEEGKLRDIYLDRRKRLLLERELQLLNQAADRFAARHGRRPSHLQDLLEPGLLRAIPEEDPLGGSYELDDTGFVQTSSDDQRLRLAPEIKERRWD
jgi:hypothetical protein